MKQIMKTALKIFTRLLALAIVLYAGMFVILSFYNSPGYAWRLLTLFSSDINDYKVFPSREIQNGAEASPLMQGDPLIMNEVEYRYRGGLRSETFEDLLERTDTRAFLIVKDDRLVYEKYIRSSREDIHTSFSVAKSFDSALIGAAIADGYIGSVEDPVIQYVPEIAGRGLDELTIRNLLRMDTGIRYRSEDDILIPFSDDALTYYPPDLRQVALSVQKGSTPIGMAFHYNNFHPLLEGLIIERAVGMPVAEYLQERIWKRMGAEFPASWSLDSERSGFEKMESGINARAVDYARFGLLYLHGGNWNGQQILPSHWVIESASPDPADHRPFEMSPKWKETGGYYGYHWWGLNNSDGSYEYIASGNLGQTIYISPGKNMVVVRLGSEGDPHVSWAYVVQAIVQGQTQTE
jgi:CubicO group peptidase (beta-lactamase class C family)